MDDNSETMEAAKALADLRESTPLTSRHHPDPGQMFVDVRDDDNMVETYVAMGEEEQEEDIRGMVSSSVEDDEQDEEDEEDESSDSQHCPPDSTFDDNSIHEIIYTLSRRLSTRFS